MAENPDNPSPNPFSSIISKFTDVFNNFRFPPPPVVVKSDAVKVTADVADEKPVSVRYPPPDASGVDVAPVKVESGEVDHVNTTNPALMWQVYAIGGFFLLKWAVARWKEQRAKKKSSDEDSPLPPAAEANE